MKKVKLWDAPTRIFHWSLAFLVSAAFVTGLTGGGLMDWHGRIGVVIAGLIGFRLSWGVLGSTYVRFSTFIKGPATVVAYLRGNWRGIGHNPLGALSVLAMLGGLALQVGTGLFANDDIAFQGPYNILVSDETESLALYLHNRIDWLLAALVALHLAAVAFYTRVKGHKLVKPMITGIKEVPLADSAPAAPPAHATGGGILALTIALAIALLAAWIAAGGLVDYLAPPAPPPVATPNW